MSGTASARRVLVVDDDASIRAILRRFLLHPLWTVDDAEDGPQALARFVAAAYDTVLVDIEMPTMGGFEVIRRLREIEARTGDRARATVIAFSSHDDDDTRARARAAGCDRYVTKPATHRAIVAAVMGAAEADTGAINPDILALLPSFLEANERELGNLEDAIARGHSEPVRVISHRLRGSFQLYGFPEAAAVCAEIESLASAGAPNSLASARERMPILYAQLQQIQARVREAPPAL